MDHGRQIVCLYTIDGDLFLFSLPEINLLQMINSVLQERQEIESNYKSLSLKFTKMQKEETEKRDEVSLLITHTLIPHSKWEI